MDESDTQGPEDPIVFFYLALFKPKPPTFIRAPEHTGKILIGELRELFLGQQNACLPWIFGNLSAVVESTWYESKTAMTPKNPAKAPLLSLPEKQCSAFHNNIISLSSVTKASIDVTLTLGIVSYDVYPWSK